MGRVFASFIVYNHKILRRWTSSWKHVSICVTDSDLDPVINTEIWDIGDNGSDHTGPMCGTMNCAQSQFRPESNCFKYFLVDLNWYCGNLREWNGLTLHWMQCTCLGWTWPGIRRWQRLYVHTKPSVAIDLGQLGIVCICIFNCPEYNSQLRIITPNVTMQMQEGTVRQENGASLRPLMRSGASCWQWAGWLWSGLSQAWPVQWPNMACNHPLTGDFCASVMWSDPVSFAYTLRQSSVIESLAECGHWTQSSDGGRHQAVARQLSACGHPVSFLLLYTRSSKR